MSMTKNYHQTATQIEITRIHMLPDGRMNAKSAAAYLGLSAKTLAMMRTNGTGPKFIKKGRIFYYEDDLKAWLNANGRSTSTAQAFHSK